MSDSRPPRPAQGSAATLEGPVESSRFRGRARAYALPVVACLVLLIGLVGVARTYAAMDALQQTALTGYGGQIAADSPVTRLVPGLLSNPARYLAALNGGGNSRRATADAFFAADRLALKQAMDRWEALAGAGLAALLLSRARPAAESRAQNSPTGVRTSVAADLTPLLLLVALLFAALSFLEI